MNWKGKELQEKESKKSKNASLKITKKVFLAYLNVKNIAFYTIFCNLCLNFNTINIPARCQYVRVLQVFANNATKKVERSMVSRLDWPS